MPSTFPVASPLNKVLSGAGQRDASRDALGADHCEPAMNSIPMASVMGSAFGFQRACFGQCKKILAHKQKLVSKTSSILGHVINCCERKGESRCSEISGSKLQTCSTSVVKISWLFKLQDLNAQFESFSESRSADRISLWLCRMRRERETRCS